MCSGANSEWGLSLLASLHIRQCVPLIARLEWRGGLFLDSAFALLWGGKRRGSGEVSEDNSSSACGSLWSGREGSLPLFFWVRGTCWVAPCGFSALLVSEWVRKCSFSYYKWFACSRNSTICLACSSCFSSIS